MSDAAQDPHRWDGYLVVCNRLPCSTEVFHTSFGAPTPILLTDLLSATVFRSEKMAQKWIESTAKYAKREGLAEWPKKGDFEVRRVTLYNVFWDPPDHPSTDSSTHNGEETGA